MKTQKTLEDFHLRKTTAREAVLQIFAGAKKPIDVATILEKLKKQYIRINRSTVFRMVNTLVEKNLVKKLEFGEGKARYELTSESHHHHMVCTKCKKMWDIEDCAAEELEKKISEENGFLVEHHRLEFFGICKNCQTR